MRLCVDAAPLPELVAALANTHRGANTAEDSDKRVVFFVAEQWLVTVRDDNVDFLAQFREQDRGEALIGLLSPSALVASPLDRHLGNFFEGVSKIAADVDLLDERVLREKASRDGIETNTLVKILTIFAAVLGSFGAVAGTFAMNVKATVFEEGDLTFAVIIGAVFVTSGDAIIFARIKKWIR